MSTYEGMPVATDDYSNYSDAVAVAPATVTGSEERPLQRIRRNQRPEFYKPFHYILLLYLFFYCSRIPELVKFLHAGLVLQPILLAGMIMTGSVKTVLRTTIGKFMTAFTIWIAICVPLSTWKGGSFNTLLLTAQALLLIYFMAAFIRTLEDCYRVMIVMALAVTTVSILSLVVGGGMHLGDPRLALGGKYDTLADANIMAMYLVVGLPFLWFASIVKKGFMKFAYILMVVPVLAALGRTGSRMGLIALAVIGLFFLVFASPAQKVVLVLGGVIALALAVTFLPQRIMERFTTYFHPTSAAGVEAAGSAEARMILLQRGIEMSFEHPLFGVGPGEFMDAEAKEASTQGKRGLWRMTHNSFTELSSETGFLGLFLFVVPFFLTYRGLTRYRSRYPRLRVRQAALCIQIAVLACFVGAFFLSVAYSGIMYAIIGLSTAFQLAVAQDYRLTQA